MWSGGEELDISVIKFQLVEDSKYSLVSTMNPVT
jgi:hypothetical protein